MNSETIVLDSYGQHTLSSSLETYGRLPVPGYEILGELGRGGMGVVWKARQITLNRIVALKMIVEGVQLHDSDRLRFLAEAEAVAAIKHPNVVQVHEFGQNNGLPFFAMEYVDGGTLAYALSEHGPMAPLAAARMIAQVARGVQASHEVGVVHRDLKPANILLGKLDNGRTKEKSKKGENSGPHDSNSSDPLSFQPKISDFGIAKRGDRVDLTLPGTVMGTPAYMAPEQAVGNAKFVGVGADIYALGVILYECLSGRTPFSDIDSNSLLVKVIQEDAPLVRSVARTVPRDLELICAQCLAKAPHERYPSAAALADDLDRFANGDPVSVRPPSQLERTVKWARKYPARAAAYALTFLAIVLGLLAGGAISLWQNADALRSQAESALEQAEKARGEADESRTKAEKAKGEAEDARGNAVLALSREKQARENEEQTRKELAAVKAAHDTDLAYREYEANNVAQARQLLKGCPPEHRPWEWHYLDRLCYRETAVLPTGSHEALGVAFAPDNGALFTAAVIGIREWNPTTLAIEKTIPGDAFAVAISKDGKRIAAVRNKDIAVFERSTGKLIKTIPDRGETISMNEDGSRLLVCRHGANVWDVDKGTETRLPTGDIVVWCGAYAPDGKTIAIGGQGKSPKYSPGVVKVWPDGHGEVVISLHPGVPVWSIAFDPTGRLLAGGCQDGSIALCEATTGHLTRRFQGHSLVAKSVAFDPTSKQLASVSADRTLRIWNIESGVCTQVMKGHSRAVMSVAFAPDGKRIATTGLDGTARLWNADSSPEAVQLAGLNPPGAVYTPSDPTPATTVKAIAMTNDGTRIVANIPSVPIRVFDTRSGSVIWPNINRDETLQAMQISSDGRVITGVTSSSEIRDWNLQTGEERTLNKKLAMKQVDGLTTDLSRAVLMDKTSWKASTYDSVTGQKIATTDQHFAWSAPPAISPDGRLVLTAGYERNVIVWEAATGKKLLELSGHSGHIHSMAVSPDGTRIATAGEEGWVKLWDAKTARPVLTFQGPFPVLRAVGWSPDGSKLIALDDWGVAHIFDGGPRSR